MPRVAFCTLGFMRAAAGQPLVQGFMDRLDSVGMAVEAADGFLWWDGYVGREGWAGRHAMPEAFPDGEHSDAAATLSLWSDLASVRAFAYHDPHAEALRGRADWFLKTDWPTYVAWWVDDDQVPSWADAMERLAHLHDHGSTPHAFTFTLAFDPAGQPYSLRVAGSASRAEDPA